MPTGSDLRRYRKALDLGQREFASRLGIAQATLSLIETGKVGLSEALQQKLGKEFKKRRYSLKYDEFCRATDAERRSGQTMVGHPDVTYATLPVWLWEDGFDLGAPPNTAERRGIVTVRTSSSDAIAFEMPKGSSHWIAGEILVFIRSSMDECRAGSLCLVQMRSPRAKHPRTIIAIARYDESGRHRILQFEPADPSEPVFTPNPDHIEGLLRCVYRARYLEA